MRKVLFFLLFILLLHSILMADINNGLVAYYQFNGNANDESWNGNNGSVNGNNSTIYVQTG